MEILDRARALALLDELPFMRLAGYDQQRQALYAVPLAFARAGETLLIAVSAHGRLAGLLNNQRHGICLEADEVQPDLSFRSIIGTVAVDRLDDPAQALVALAARYAAEWGRWRPAGGLQAYRLHITTIQGRIKR
ncbi:MAG: pyridoxamine 5'-phosphate oxidase family protein [Herpetosiphonaceae bacterium]|nr:pyridoxamine 5'-phosphate oxidase family protein [Herpetosiphonaceae bacterium]